MADVAVGGEDRADVLGEAWYSCLASEPSEPSPYVCQQVVDIAPGEDRVEGGHLNAAVQDLRSEHLIGQRLQESL